MKREKDKNTDQQLKKYVSLDNPQSFFLMAGAGSGKTRSLVSILEHLRSEWRQNLKSRGSKVAVITFTNAASEEIRARTSHDSTFHISTIHSFAWEMIKHFQRDIRDTLCEFYQDKLIGLSKRSATHKQKEEVAKYKKKLSETINATKFYYSANTNVTKRGYLSHSEVIAIMNLFLKDHSTFSQIMIRKYPVLLIDECQDTNKHLLSAFIKIEETHENFCLGLIGDMMQRVYTGGLENLPSIVEYWSRFPKKEMNWRSQKRIVDFINELRKDTDSLQQYQNKEKNDGVLRAYIIEDKNSDSERKTIENKIRKNFWQAIGKKEDITTLILEHKMAARRNDFLNIFNALDKGDTKNAVKDGIGKEMVCVKELIIPFIEAIAATDEFELLQFFRKERVFEEMIGIEQVDHLKRKTDNIRQEINEDTTLREAVSHIKALDITELPSAFLYSNEEDSKTSNWQEAMEIPLIQFEKYFNYKDQQSPYVTQQGSKGLEYDHVMVIMSDHEAGGHLFSYGKVDGTIESTDTDQRNERDGKDNSIERTKRLLYVAASRAMESLGLVIYSKDIAKTKGFFIENSLVYSSEIITEEELSVHSF